MQMITDITKLVGLIVLLTNIWRKSNEWSIPSAPARAHYNSM